MSAGIVYAVRVADAAAHRLEVWCTITTPDPVGQRLRLPVWIPGSYMVREFSRNILAIDAECADEAVALIQLDKHTWQAAPCPPGQALRVRCEVYAWDLSVRGAHVDRNHAFFNGTCVFLEVLGQREQPCELELLAPDAEIGPRWQVATAMMPLAVDARGFGRYRAADYDELIDHPVEMGDFTRARFEVAGVPHEVVLSGRHDCDFERLCADLQQICSWQVELFGALPPMSHYLFLVTVVGDGYGGLEHRASTALLAARNDLPWRGMIGTPEGYVQFLGLCSHEYFHSWNVKRIMPAAFQPYRLERENHTRLLWFFEGFTSYYDDHALCASGCIDVPTYLGLLAKNISSVQRGGGRLRQSVAASSFDAWTKYYRQDENAPNAIVSYYTKGALIALLLDLRLRVQSGGETSLDELMRRIWQAHGLSGRGVAEDDIYAHAAALIAPWVEDGGAATRAWLYELVETCCELPLVEGLASVGVRLEFGPARQDIAAATLGVKLVAHAGEVRIAQVFDGGSAQRAGLAAGDVLVAVEGLRVSTTARLDAQLARMSGGDMVVVHAFRRDELFSTAVSVQSLPDDVARLVVEVDAPAEMQRLRAAWLEEKLAASTTLAE